MSVGSSFPTTYDLSLECQTDVTSVSLLQICVFLQIRLGSCKCLSSNCYLSVPCIFALEVVQEVALALRTCLQSSTFLSKLVR